MKFQKELTVAAVTSMLIFGFSARAAEPESGTGEAAAVTAPAEKCGQHEGCDHKEGNAMKGGCDHKKGDAMKGGCDHKKGEAMKGGCEHKEGEGMKGGCGHKDAEAGKAGCGHKDDDAPADR